MGKYDNATRDELAAGVKLAWESSQILGDAEGFTKCEEGEIVLNEAHEMTRGLVVNLRAQGIELPEREIHNAFQVSTVIVLAKLGVYSPAEAAGIIDLMNREAGQDENPEH